MSTRCFGARPLPFPAAPPSANTGKALHLASVVRALQPAGGSLERALSPRERQASECTESGVPSTDLKAAGPGARGERARKGERARPSRARSARASRSRKRTTNRARIRLCSDGGGAWNVRAKASHLASVVRKLRAPRAEAESALSAHESVKPASAPSQACRAAIRHRRRTWLARGTCSWR